MKKIYFILALAFVALSCEEVIVPENDVTPVIVAENQMYAEVPGLEEFFKWSDADKLQVSAAGQTVEFSIMGDYALTGAKFTGTDLVADKYTISYFVPEGDSRLPVTLVLEDVDTYKNVVFSSEWAQEHGGSFKMNNIFVLELAFPSYIKTLSAVEFELGPDVKYTLAYDNKDVSALKGSFKVIVAGVDDVELTADQLLKLTVVSGESSWMYVVTGQSQVFAGGCHAVAVDANAWEDNFTGKGSKYDPHVISTKEQLIAAKELVVDGRKTYFVIDADIDMQGVEWTPFCPSTGMMYDIDGRNHKISNLTVSSSADYASFAGQLTGRIANLTLENPKVEYTQGKDMPVAIVAAVANDAVIENVKVTGGVLNVSQSQISPAGFIAAQISGATVSKCSVAGTLTHAGTAAELNVGGLIGQVNTSVVSECTGAVEVTITAASRVVSGFIGSIRSTSSVLDCSSTCGLKAVAEGRYSGGFIAYVAGANSVIKNCTCKADVSGMGDNCGGMFGSIRSSNGVRVENCHYEGNFTTADASKKGNQGSLIGCIESADVVVSGCSAKGNIEIVYNHDNIGGIVGNITATATGFMIEKCTYSGQIGQSKNRSIVGGVAGYVQAAGTIKDCWTSGKIAGTNHSIGGVAGSLLGYEINILNCGSDISLSKCGHGIGGIVGRAENNKNSEQGQMTNYNNRIEGCIYWGTEISTSKSPGVDPTANHSGAAIVGKTVEKNTLKNCWRRPDLVMSYYAGDLAQFNTPFDQADADANTALVFNHVAKYYTPYHGKAASAGETASAVAKRIGWDANVWDLSGDTPKLR